MSYSLYLKVFLFSRYTQESLYQTVCNSMVWVQRGLEMDSKIFYPSKLSVFIIRNDTRNLWSFFSIQFTHSFYVFFFFFFLYKRVFWLPFVFVFKYNNNVIRGGDLVSMFLWKR